MQKHFRGGSREWLWIAAGALLLAAALLMPLSCALAGSLSMEEQLLQTAYEENEIIRIHIIANSDSAQDQAMKLQIRDALIERFGNILTNTNLQDADAVFQLLVQQKETMLQTAVSCAAQYGFHGTITAETGLLHLPAKQYGQVYLPEGNYRALRMIVGEGNGQNWWCVLYPQLCLALTEEKPYNNAQLHWKMQHIFQHWLLLK